MSDSPKPDSSAGGPISAPRRFLSAVCCALAICTAAVGASAQQTAEPRNAAPPVRLVSAEQGRQIAAAALDQEEPLRGTQDCSHLVHQVYSLAGYEYPYASSFDLYAGNGNFRRVRHAQSGDLITWPGHVGIVLDPRQHTFYSLVRSGLQSEDYLSPYWRSRGRPRFYRYAVSGPAVETAKSERSTQPRSVQSAVLGSIPARKEIYSDPEKAGLPEASETSLRSPVPAGRVTASAAKTESDSSIVITTEQRRPTAAEAYDKILGRSAAAASVLYNPEPLQVNTAVVILDELRVERVETKRDKGWVHLEINSHVRIATEGVDFKRRREKVRWELRRDASGWVVIAPAEPAYVTRDVAVRELAAQLAEMTQSDAAAKNDESLIGQEARIANLLSALLQK